MRTLTPRDAWSSTVTHKLFDPEPWRRKAQCLPYPTDIFFPEHGDKPTEAKSICAQCCVWKECLQFALKNHECVGIWGGLSIKERRSICKLSDVKKCIKCNRTGVSKESRPFTCNRCLNSKIIKGNKLK